ncbi:Retrovirus-related Gag polyprotein from transposon gypsy [Eumeta japonica]|uniref:Retrovirus-related Gag polyprotein from transposon gypsy n=1 Tax=Eumeta variegata TaxID=151549 RepID=A0A4C1TCG0_EUMVA|nr:Retrovirus-related Gag polyprotein from transposon gypsy [Eumeta japonica]
MAQEIDVNLLLQQLANLTLTVQTLQKRIEEFPVNSAIAQPTATPLTPTILSYGTANEVNLDVFKSLPTFDGTQNKYRIWRKDVTRAMNSIENVIQTNKYAEALMIIKTKVTGPAADILENHDTFNFQAIINRLDYTYSDQRPLYMLQEEMRKLNKDE